MVRTADTSVRDAKIAELKRLITSGHYETLEKLEEAVDAFLWGEEQDEADSADGTTGCGRFPEAGGKPR